MDDFEAEAVEKLLDNPGFCSLLKAPRYRAVGVGRDGNIWVLTLADDAN